MSKWVGYYKQDSKYRFTDGTVMQDVSHVHVDAKDAEAALKAAQKALGKKGKIFRVDRCPEWSVDAVKGKYKKPEIEIKPVVLEKDPNYVAEHFEPGTVEERIHHLRRIVLIHSILYYQFDVTVVKDNVFDGWSYELATLQDGNPEAFEAVQYMKEAFRDFDGSGGSMLPLSDPRATSRALRLYQSTLT